MTPRPELTPKPTIIVVPAYTGSGGSDAWMTVNALFGSLQLGLPKTTGPPCTVPKSILGLVQV